MSQQIGADTRGNILPTGDPSVGQGGFGVLGPDYDYADELAVPGAVGVRRGGSFGAVMGAVKGMNYYMDTIAFGQSSNSMTEGLPFQHYGINYFIKTGQKCSNGADAWDYIELIPKGDAFGKNVQKGLASVGYSTELRGFAPGMLEDIKKGINPLPLMKAMFGTGYAECKKVTKVVGDERGRIQDSEGNPWVDNPKTIQWIGGRPYQTKWVKARDIDASTWSNTPKTLNPDGSPARQSEGFRNFLDDMSLSQLLGLLGAAITANLIVYKIRYT
jgi:hypothetical protein